MTPWQIERQAQRERNLAHPEMVRAFAEITERGLTPCRVSSTISDHGIVMAFSEERHGLGLHRSAIMYVSVDRGKMTMVGGN